MRLRASPMLLTRDVPTCAPCTDCPQSLTSQRACHPCRAAQHGLCQLVQSNAMSLTPDDVRAFIRTHHRGVLATSRRDGGAQLSPVLVGVDEDGSLIISTRETAMKTANVRRYPRASVCVFADEFIGEWVQAEGSATVESLPAAMGWFAITGVWPASIRIGRSIARRCSAIDEYWCGSASIESVRSDRDSADDG